MNCEELFKTYNICRNANPFSRNIRKQVASGVQRKSQIGDKMHPMYGHNKGHYRFQYRKIPDKS